MANEEAREWAQERAEAARDRLLEERIRWAVWAFALLTLARVWCGCAPARISPPEPGTVPWFVACESFDDLAARNAVGWGCEEPPPCPWLAAENCDPLRVLNSIERARRVNYCAEVLPASDVEACHDGSR